MARRFGLVQGSVQILDSDTSASLNARACTGNAVEEARVVLQPVVEPLVLAGKANENAGGATVTSNDNLLG